MARPSLLVIICRQWKLLLLLCIAIALLIFVSLQMYAEMQRPPTYQKVGTKKIIRTTIRPSTTKQPFALPSYIDTTSPPSSHPSLNIPDDDQHSIAIGCAISSRGIQNQDPQFIGQSLPFFQAFLSSFCKTASAGYHYHFYLAYDKNDPFLTQKDTYDPIQLFRKEFFKITDILCPSTFNMSIHFVKCNHVGHPAWAQNDAMMEAYLDNMPYFFRINDDTSLQTQNWTEYFIEALQKYNPPNVGVVGPTHSGGNDMILTYDFVHKTHIDIFGLYYPRTFTTWWADDWISRVYEPDRVRKLESVRLMHTSQVAKRYDVEWKTSEVFKAELEQGQATLERYLAQITRSINQSQPDGSKVISMSLFGDDQRYTYGALRNAQLSVVYFPDWKLRIYIEKPNSEGKMKYPAVPNRILRKLKSLGADLYYVNSEDLPIPPMMWRFLVADDMSVTHFIVRDADSRLSDRDAIVVKDWLDSGKPFHCIRDHPSHGGYPIMGGAWGGKPDEIQALLPHKWADFMRGYSSDYIQDMFFLGNVIWPRVSEHAYCHDSVSCLRWPNAVPFPIARHGTEHIGEVYDAYGIARWVDIEILMKTPKTKACVPWNEPGINVEQEVSSANENAVIFNNTKTEWGLIEEVLPPYWPRSEPYTNIIIWTMDYHISPVLDVKNLLLPLGVQFIDKSLSTLCNMTQTCQTDLRIINTTNGFDINSDIAREFYTNYQDDEEMQSATHFLCFMPAALCEIYMNFNKPIIIVATTRYEQGRFLDSRWMEWNEHLYKLSQDPRSVVGANNHYDVEYMRYFTGFDPEYLPSYCGYTGVQYNPTKPQFLIAPIRGSEPFRDWFLERLNNVINESDTKIQVGQMEELYPSYTFKDLASHRGIIHVPYQVSMISMCEHYRMRIPLFVPSLALLVKWHATYGVISQRTWNKVRSLMGYELDNLSPISGVINGNYDPNDDIDQGAIRYWLRFADYYQWPHIIHFDSVEHLVHLLKTTDLGEVSGKMFQFNNSFKRDILQKWTKVLDRTMGV